MDPKNGKKQLRILLIKPPQQVNEIQPPLGLGYLASSVKDIAELKIIDSLRDKLSVKELLKIISKSEPDIIGIQCYTVDFLTVKYLVDKIKIIFPSCIVVLGGPHPTLDPINTLKNTKADYIFLGDSEESFQMFVKLITNKKLNKAILKSIPGFAYRNDKKEILVNATKFPENLDKFDPSWNLYGLKKYPLAPHGAFCKQSPTAPIIITRGCPFNCTYCGGPKISGRKIRSHSVDYIIKQIEILVTKYGIREILIEDDNFTINRKFVEDFCQTLINKNWGITWTCPNGVRLDTLDEKLIKLMKKSGLYSLSVGIESGSDRIRQLMRKNLNTQTIEEKINLIKRCGIKNIVGFFILGYPGETVEDIKKTINFALRLPLTKATFSAFKPFPGTDIYNKLVEKGEIKDLDYNQFSLDKIAWSPKGISQKKLKNLRRKAFLKFYLRPKIMLKMISEVKNIQHLRFILVRIYRWLIK